MAATAAALATSAVCAASDDADFRTPSGLTGCGYYENSLRCDVEGGIVPLPPTPKSCQLDWGPGFGLAAHGRAYVVCAGDTARNPSAPVLRYGTTWHRGSFTCSASPNGLRCTNADRRGFFISKGAAYRF